MSSFDPKKGSGGVKLRSKVNFAPIFTKFGGKEPLCKLLKNLSIFWLWAPPFDPPRRVQGRHVGVKPYLVSDLHQIWCEVTFLQVIKGAFIFWLWFPLMTPFKLNSKDYFWIILLDRNTLDGFFYPISSIFQPQVPTAQEWKVRNIYDTIQEAVLWLCKGPNSRKPTSYLLTYKKEKPKSTFHNQRKAPNACNIVINHFPRIDDCFWLVGWLLQRSLICKACLEPRGWHRPTQ